MNQPLYSIGIPTYNRCELLRESLSAALSQSYSPIEVIVSDNASTDGTEDLVRSFSDSRIRYIRLSSNLGAAANFENCLKHAHGEYFSWLQDDDLIFSDFADRAVGSLTQTQAVAYFASAVHTANPEFFYSAPLYSPPFKLNWVQCAGSEVDIHTLLGVALYASFAIPPVISFRTSALRQAIHHFPASACPLYAERVLLVALAIQGKVIVSPHVAGVFRTHSEQLHIAMMNNSLENRKQWNVLVQELEAIVEVHEFSEVAFAAYLRELPSQLLDHWFWMGSLWKANSGFPASIHRAVTMELNSRGIDHADSRSPLRFITMLKETFKLVLPPVVWSAMHAAKDFIRERVNANH